MKEENMNKIIQVASLIGTDAKAPEEKLLNLIHQEITLAEKALLERIKGEVEGMIEPVEQDDCGYGGCGHDHYVQGSEFIEGRNDALQDFITKLDEL